MKILQINHELNTSKSKIKNNFDSKEINNINFGASPSQLPAKSKFFDPFKKLFMPISNAMDNLKTKMAFGITKILGTETAQNVVKKSTTPWLAAHLTTLVNVVLTVFYVKKTLENDKLDTNKRKTLAINQTATSILSTFMSYSVNNALYGKIDKFTDKFMKANAHETKDVLAHYGDGIKTAASIMIFMTIYRFIAPVLVTPLANHIGNKIQEKNNSELVKK